ncbi:hypothetical protein [Cohnella sp. AR92]|uniref:hypothetical protein n=1 Tax=Cohnella sp. AR92 TaxID=648716 RepID=UPI000F8D67E1|nr:hypothetical protein [Cohnella sp. AR92]RUS47888.1 hypothetical protein ELR57_04935 [Cohnella sp. AR92]
MLKVNSKHAFLLILATIFLFLGILFLVNGTTWGYQSAESFLSNRGGMNTEEYLMVIRSKIESFKDLGIIFTSLGGSTILFTILNQDFWASEK